MILWFYRINRDGRCHTAGPPHDLSTALAEAGLPEESLVETDEFDPGSHHEEDLLTRQGREAALALAAAVAAADSDLVPEERDQFRTLAEELDVDLDPVELVRSGGVGEYVDVAATTS